MGNSALRSNFGDCISNFVLAQTEDGSTHLKQLLSINTTIEDVHEVLTLESIRQLRKHRPGKLEELLNHCVGLVFELHEKSLGSINLEDGETVMLLNGIRIISRIFPWINDDYTTDEFLSLLWGPRGVPDGIDKVDVESTGFRIAGALTRSCFIRGFSIPTICSVGSVDPNKVCSGIVWGNSGGIAGLPQGRLAAAGCSLRILENRVEVVQMIVSVLSRPLFQSFTEYEREVPLFNALIQSGDFVHTADLLVSLLLFVMESEPREYSVPVISRILSPQRIPVEDRLFSSCMDLINILLDSHSSHNAFREIVSHGISEKNEFELIAKSLKNKFMSIYATNSRLSVSRIRKMDNVSSFILFVFNLINLNEKGFIPALTTHCGSEIILALLYLIGDMRTTDSGLVNTVSFLLIALTSNRDFVVGVFNSVYRGELNFPPSELRLADIFVLTIARLLPGKPDWVVEMLLTSICNSSPFINGLSLSSAQALLSLTERFSRKQSTSSATQYLIAAVSNLVYYQRDSSSQLIYALLLKGPKILSNVETTDIGGAGDSLKKLIDFLTPRIEAVCKDPETDHNQVLQLIRNTSIVGVLPVPRATAVRQVQQTDRTRLWFTSFLWGVVFNGPLGKAVDRDRVKLIRVPPPEKDAVPI